MASARVCAMVLILLAAGCRNSESAPAGALPGFVHATSEVPGTAVMRRLRADISYVPRDLERGGEVRLTTRSPEAMRAIHEFLAFQRTDHHAEH